MKTESSKEPKYAYAYDEEKRLVKITSLTKETRDGHIYKCLSCDSPMIAKLGEKNIHHFAHKVEVECNNETYLHRLSKEILRKRFYNSESFNISFYQTSKCDLYDQCPSHQADSSCKKRALRTYDLKKYYCDCLLEDWDPITNMRPDLKLVSNNPNTPDIWLEIFFTHKCTEDKINSERKIIEIKIENEEQAESLAFAGISEPPHLEDFGDIGDFIDENANFIFHKFERDIEPTPGISNEYKMQVQATLLKTGYIQITCLSCRKKHVFRSPNEVAAVMFSVGWYNFLNQAKEAFAKYGLGNFRSCHWCKNYHISKYDNPYCYYHKHLGIVGPPEMKHAYFCGWCYKPIFPDALPPVVLNEAFSLDQARVLMQNHPPTPTERPVYYSAPQSKKNEVVSPDTGGIKKSDFEIPYNDDPLLPFISDASFFFKGDNTNSTTLCNRNL